MMTFLPYPDIEKSLAVLDDRRLSAMRRESLTMYNAITADGRGWRNHPITVMYRNQPNALAAYFNAAEAEWIARGFNSHLPALPIKDDGRGSGDFLVPWWWGWQLLHSSHQATLLRKDTEFYTGEGLLADLSQDVVYAERALTVDGTTHYLFYNAHVYRSRAALYPPAGLRWYSDAKENVWEA